MLIVLKCYYSLKSNRAPLLWQKKLPWERLQMVYLLKSLFFQTAGGTLGSHENISRHWLSNEDAWSSKSIHSGKGISLLALFRTFCMFPHPVQGFKCMCGSIAVTCFKLFWGHQTLLRPFNLWISRSELCTSELFIMHRCVGAAYADKFMRRERMLTEGTFSSCPAMPWRYEAPRTADMIEFTDWFGPNHNQLLIMVGQYCLWSVNLSIITIIHAITWSSQIWLNHSSSSWYKHRLLTIGW